MGPSISKWGFVHPLGHKLVRLVVLWLVGLLVGWSVWNPFFILPKLWTFAHFKGQHWPWKCSSLVTTLLTCLCVCLPSCSKLKTIWHWNSGKDVRLLSQQNYKMFMRRTVMNMTTTTTTMTTTTTTTSTKQQRKGDASLFTRTCWELCRGTRWDVNPLAKRLRKMLMFLRYFWWFLVSDGDSRGHQWMNHPAGLAIGQAFAEKVVWVPIFGLYKGI